MAQIIHAPAMSAERRTLFAPAVAAQDGAAQDQGGRDAVTAAAAAQQRDVPQDALQAAQPEAYLEAQQAAQQEADLLAEQAARAAAVQQAQLQQEYHEAAERGYQEGMAAAQATAQTQLAAGLQQLEKLGEALSQERAALLRESADNAAVLAYEVLCKLLGDSLLTREGVAAHVAQVLARTEGAQSVTVRLHPADLALLEQAGPERRHSTVQWLADPSLSSGGCIVDSERGSFEARLQWQLESVLALLVKARQHAPTAGDWS